MTRQMTLDKNMPSLPGNEETELVHFADAAWAASVLLGLGMLEYKTNFAQKTFSAVAANVTDAVMKYFPERDAVFEKCSDTLSPLWPIPITDFWHKEHPFDKPFQVRQFWPADRRFPEHGLLPLRLSEVNPLTGDIEFSSRVKRDF